MQTIMKNGKIEKQSRLDELQQHRLIYCNEMTFKLKSLEQRKKESVQLFNNTIKELDKEIERLTKKKYNRIGTRFGQ